MKIQFNLIKKLQASAMVAVLILAVLIAGTLAAYLVMVQNEYTQVARSQSWNSSMALAEAGTEEGMGLVNLYVIGGNSAKTYVTNWPSRAAANGWTDIYGDKSVWTITRNNVDGYNGYYQVWVTNNISGTNPIIVSVGVAKWALGTASVGGPMFAQTILLPTSQSQVAREVYVQTSFQPLFSGAMTTLKFVDLGPGSVIDSFDSADPNASAWNASLGWGTYTSSKRKSNGNVATDGTISGAISGGTIYGRADTGPGGSVTTGTVGSVPWVNGGNSGIQPGYSSDDMNVNFPPVSLPSNLGSPVLFNGSTINSSGYYQMDSVGNLTIQGSGSPPSPVNATIYMPNGFSYSGNSGNGLTIGTNASVTIYLGGNVSITGNGSLNNLTQNALNLSLYALPNVTSIKLAGNAAYTGTIYAPSASITFGGSGNSTYDIVGSVVSASVTFNGHPNFHYDENLARKGPSRGFVPTVWKEIVQH